MTYYQELERWVLDLGLSQRQALAKITVTHHFFKQILHTVAYGAPVPELPTSLAPIRCDIVNTQEVPWIAYDQNGKEMERSSK